MINKEWPSNSTRAFKNKTLDELAWMAVDSNTDGREAAKAEISIRQIEQMNTNARANSFLSWVMIILTIVILVATLDMAEIFDLKFTYEKVKEFF